MFFQSTARAACRQVRLRLPSAREKSTFAVAIDIDGVLYRGSEVLPNAVAAVKTLQQRNIPMLFLTNGGGQTEGKRAELLTSRLSLEEDGHAIPEQHMFLAHTPMNPTLNPNMVPLTDKHVVVLGRNGKSVLKNYGFTNVTSIADFLVQHPCLLPSNEPAATTSRRGTPQPVDAIFGIMGSEVWDRDLQLCCDILRSDGNVGTLSPTQKVPIYLSCPDFEYVTEFPVPRFGAGVFPIVLRHIFKKLTGRKLEMKIFGKPHRDTYDLAEQRLSAIAADMGYDGIDTIYGIGDNPESDIKGANGASDRWSSILVRSGVFIGDSNDELNPADKVVADIGEALTYILSENMTVHD
jgi:HAD superfamily hydrolase (TIGR01456 family)